MLRVNHQPVRPRLQDRGVRERGEAQGESVFLRLASLPADALAVPPPLQPERARGRLEDLPAGAFAHTGDGRREPEHVLLRYLKYKSGATCSYSRFAAIVRAIVWLKKDAMEILKSYGIAPPPNIGDIATGMPYLPGFEKVFLKSVG